MDYLENMDIMLPFVEIVGKINGMNLMILLFVNALKIVSIMEVLIYYYMKGYLNNYFNKKYLKEIKHLLNILIII